MNFSQSYAVFEKELKAVGPDDLVRLRDVPEGWFVEYKSQLSDVRSAAKSLSAFANSYGGWLFYGIAEKPGGSRTAGSFLGIPSADVPAIEQGLQRAASQHVSPTPYYSHRVFFGPIDAIGLGPDRAIIVVHAPMGRNAPYVHSSGRIYRRLAEASDPAVETDRHLLDLLWARGRESRRRFAKLVKTKPKLAAYESGGTFLKIWLFPDPWGKRKFNRRLRSKPSRN